MMGILISLAGMAGLTLSVIAGSWGVSLYRKTIMADGGGWLPFWLLALVVAAIVVAAGVVLLAAVKGSPPSGEDFTRVMKGLFLFGAAPGFGMLVAGALAAWRAIN